MDITKKEREAVIRYMKKEGWSILPRYSVYRHNMGYYFAKSHYLKGMKEAVKLFNNQ